MRQGIDTAEGMRHKSCSHFDLTLPICCVIQYAIRPPTSAASTKLFDSSLNQSVPLSSASNDILISLLNSVTWEKRFETPFVKVESQNRMAKSTRLCHNHSVPPTFIVVSFCHRRRLFNSSPMTSKFLCGVALTVLA